MTKNGQRNVKENDKKEGKRRDKGQREEADTLFIIYGHEKNGRMEGLEG